MELPKRKHPRLKDYDYSLPGYYYVTIHIEGDHLLSLVGRGLAPAERGLAPEIILTKAGKVAEEQLFALEKRYSYVKLDKYVIMPTHIHMIIQLKGEKWDSPRPSLPDIVCAYKSLTTRETNRLLRTPGQKRFQTSFYESVLRNESAYRECWKYIDENPHKWALNPEDR